MNKELEQADHIAAIREALEDARIVVGNTHLINVALSSLESLEAQSKPIQPLVGVLRKLRGAIHAGPDTNTGSRAGHVESLVILGLVDEIDAALSSASEDAG